MSMDFYFNTLVVRDAATLAFEDGMSLYQAADNDCFAADNSDEGDLFCLSGHSRGAWIGFTLQEICELGGTPGLGFLYNSDYVPSKWRFEDEDTGADACGFLFEGAQLDAAIKAIDAFLLWSRQNLETLYTVENFTYCTDEDGIREAVEGCAPGANPTQEDGDSPNELYDFVVSVRQVMLTARKYGKPVLHVANAAHNFPVKVS